MNLLNWFVLPSTKCIRRHIFYLIGIEDISTLKSDVCDSEIDVITKLDTNHKSNDKLGTRFVLNQYFVVV